MALACIQPRRIAEIIGISEPTLAKHYSFEIAGAAERLLGKAAKTLYDLLDAKNLGAACFVLKTQGKAYGWTERHESNTKGDAPLIDLSKLTDDELNLYEKIIRKAMCGPGAASGGTN